MEKDNVEHIELAREPTIQPLPHALRVEGGIRLDAQGTDSANLKLGPDGHVTIKTVLLFGHIS